MGRIIAVVIGCLLLALLVYAVRAGLFQTGTVPETADRSAGRIRVVASFYPLYELAGQIGGPHLDVANITPGGAEPHDYEPTPRDMAALYKARLFLFNGNGLDAWGERIQPDLARQGVEVLKISDHLDSLKQASPDAGAAAPYDPHFWLDPMNMEKEADLIADALIRIDPAHQADYGRNRDAVKARLAGLDGEYQAGLADCRSREIVVSHNAFSYLAARYRLRVISISGLNPDEEPSPQRMAEIVRLVRDRHVTHIFFETLVSPKLAGTIASETGAASLELNPIEGLTDREIAEGKNYISIMQENLAHLRVALQCR